MVQDCLSKAVLRRLRELGLPSSLMELGEFHENFLDRGWIMFVRDGDKTADVHLVEPPARNSLNSSEQTRTRPARAS